jgi:hypothetical protein
LRQNKTGAATEEKEKGCDSKTEGRRNNYCEVWGSAAHFCFFPPTDFGRLAKMIFRGNGILLAEALLIQHVYLFDLRVEV